MSLYKIFHKNLQTPILIEPLAFFRVVFGLLMALAMGRNIFLGWVSKFYIQPNLYFKFYGFYWLEPLCPWAMHLIAWLLVVAAIFIALGFFYRWAAICFFIGFTYLELIDVTHYLNHYYLICLISFLLIFLPAHRKYSIDVLLNNSLKLNKVPRWTISILQLQIGIVFFYAGLAKLQPDWLFDAQPLRIWLLRLDDIPFFGPIFILPITAHIFSWAGALYDLSIPFLLSWWRTRPYAYAAVFMFHGLTALCFNIGMFPFMMMAFTIIFFSGFWHQKIFTNFERIFILTLSKLKLEKQFKVKNKVTRSWLKSPSVLVYLFVFWQLLFPLRHLLYPGNVLWTEEGFRFSWRVMLVEKTGTASFKIYDAETNQESLVDNRSYLSAKQEVMMSTQADLIAQFAQYLANDYKKNKGYINPIVTVDCFVALNGRPSRRYIREGVDLTKVNNGILHKSWIVWED